MLVDSEDDDEGKGEEETVGSSTKHEVMALVNGNSVQAAYLNCLMEGEPWCLPAGRVLEQEPPALLLSCGSSRSGCWGGRNSCCLACWLLLRCCCSVPCVGDDGEQHGRVSPQETREEETRGS